MRPTVAVLVVAAASLVTGCTDGGSPADEARLDPPVATVDRGPRTGMLVVLVQNHEPDVRRIVLRVGGRRILSSTLPGSRSLTGHPAVHRFRFRVVAGRHRFAAVVDGPPRAIPVRIRAGGRRWVVVQNGGGSPGTSVEAFRRRPAFG